MGRILRTAVVVAVVLGCSIPRAVHRDRLSTDAGKSDL
jgi:hypothetical protein